MTKTVMGFVLQEQEDPSKFRRVLDIGCGPGGWLLEVAQAYPQIEKLYGIDISSMIIHHARQQAEQQNMMTGPKERIEFLPMDALLVLEFPRDFFDLVNFRFGVSFMRQWDWPKMLSEMNRVTRTGGIVRIVDGETNVLFSESKALSQFYELMTRALFRAGHLFKEEQSGLIDELPSLLVRSGFQKIETRESVIEYRAGTELGDTWIKDIMYMFRTFRPFLHRYGCDPKGCNEICQQATQDMQQPGFTANYRLVTTWAINPKETNAMNILWP